VHTSSELSEKSFEIKIDDVAGTSSDLFPGFDEHDRIGVVVSSPHGALGASHKEVLVEAHGDRLLEAVNDRAITRLVVPEDLDVGRPEQREGLASYAARLRCAFLYSKSGRVTDANIAIRGDDATARYVANALNPSSRAAELGPGHIASVIEAHLDEVSQETRDRLRRERRVLVVGGRVCETYRRITPECALQYFAGGSEH